MVLLHTLHSLASKNRWKISVAHFNHQLRGRASDADEKLVRLAAKELSLPFFGERGDVAGFAKRSKISVEMAARKLRHEFLARVAKREKIPAIALAHHADDQVELFFLRLLRGAGGEGLAGMKWRSFSPVDKNISLVRPLLDFSKSELLGFACEQKIHFREDATNLSNDFLRNRIRNELLPLLQKKYQPGLSKTVLRLMDIVGAESEFVSEVAQNWLTHAQTAFEKLPVALQRKVLQSQLTKLGLISDFDLIEQLRSTAGKSVSISSSLTVVRDTAGKLSCQDQIAKDFNEDESKVHLLGKAGQMEFAGRKFNWAMKPFNGSRGHALRQMESFDSDSVGSEIILRHWRAGDRFQPIGLKSATKLQDLFVNAKIPAIERRKLVLATTAAGEIFWVEGLRIGERFKLEKATKRTLVWKWSEISV